MGSTQPRSQLRVGVEVGQRLAGSRWLPAKDGVVVVRSQKQTDLRASDSVRGNALRGLIEFYLVIIETSLRIISYTTRHGTRVEIEMRVKYEKKTILVGQALDGGLVLMEMSQLRSIQCSASRS